MWSCHTEDYVCGISFCWSFRLMVYTLQVLSFVVFLTSRIWVYFLSFYFSFFETRKWLFGITFCIFVIFSLFFRKDRNVFRSFCYPADVTWEHVIKKYWTYHFKLIFFCDIQWSWKTEIHTRKWRVCKSVEVT